MSILSQQFLLRITIDNFDIENDQHFFTDEELEALQKQTKRAVKQAVTSLYKQKGLHVADVSVEYETDFEEDTIFFE